MEIFLGILFLVIVIIAIATYVSFSNKINLVKDKFRAFTKEYYKIAEQGYSVKTNGKKVKQWDKEHAIDYIINQNVEPLNDALESYKSLQLWWEKNFLHIKKECYSYIDVLSNSMMIWGNKFRDKATNELNQLIDLYDPQKLKIQLYTYTYYEEGEAHYSPDSNEIIYSQSAFPRVSFSYLISPEELKQRMDFLSKFNYSITKYQYNMDNQRALVDKNLRRRIMERDKYICQNCHKKCSIDEIEIDHIFPVSKGGKTVESNLQVLCSRCNRRKSNKTNYIYNNIYAVYMDEETNNAIQTTYNNHGKSVKHNDNERTKDNEAVSVQRTHITSDNHNKTYIKLNCNNSKFSNEIQLKPKINREEKTDHNRTYNYTIENKIKDQQKSHDKNIFSTWQYLQSSNVNSVYYNQTSKDLFLRFNNGSIYKYSTVPLHVFLQLLRAESKGRFVRETLFIYQCKRVNIDDVK